MTADSQWGVQESVHAALVGDAGVTTLVPAARIFDHVPQDSGFPYIVLGEATGGVWDSKDSDGMEQTLTVHCWSRYRGLKEVKQIMGAVVDALDQKALAVTGHNLVLCRFVFSNTLLDPDGLTRHGVQRFRVITERQ